MASDVLGTAHFVVRSALDYATNEDIPASLLQEVINPKLYDLQNTRNVKIVEILEPHSSGHPITYNHYLTDNVQKAQAQRRKRDLRAALQRFFGQLFKVDHYYFNPETLLSQLVETTVANMDRYATYNAIDVMEAYYKVCLVIGCGRTPSMQHGLTR